MAILSLVTCSYPLRHPVWHSYFRTYRASIPLSQEILLGPDHGWIMGNSSLCYPHTRS